MRSARRRIAGVLLLAAWGLGVREAQAAEPRVRVRLFASERPITVAPEGAPTRLVGPGRGAAELFVDGRNHPSPLRVGAKGAVRVGGATYRGAIEVHRSASGLEVVNEVPLEDYVAGTLHREVSPHWEREALRAQAVAIRTYALHRMAVAPRGRRHDLEASPGDQVYGGIEAETSGARQACQETRGEYLVWSGRPILAAFHSTAGGRTASAEEVWGRPVPYLVSREVIGEAGSPHSAWRVGVSRAELGGALDRAGKPVGSPRGLRILERSASGRVSQLRVDGTGGSRTLSGKTLRAALGSRLLKSTLFEVQRSGEGFVFTGAGYGHGVGMSQWGARALARGGADYRKILARFYPGARLQRLGVDAKSYAVREPVR
jgi:stage II sporulation protein D